MNEIQLQIKNKADELAVASDRLTKKYAESQRLLTELPVDAAKVQTLMEQLTHLRQSCPAPQRATSSPKWYDTDHHEGEMGDRRLKIST